MKLEQQKALDILYENEGGKVILDTVHGHSRWSVSHVLIVEIDGRFYRTRYSVGATESQDESPWQDEEEVDFVEVEPKEITVIDYVEKKGSIEPATGRKQNRKFAGTLVNIKEKK